MDMIRLADIRIGDRRREDLGDIAALARSIAEYGLLSPPVLTDDGTLVAGQRRVEAMKLLGWTETPYINKGQLTAERLHEIELEENIRRKDFTEYEISKNMTDLAKVVGERLTRESCIKMIQNPLGGPKIKADSMRAVAKEIGVPLATIQHSKEHVAAVETYPALEALPKMKAISIAKQANKLPEGQRASFTQGKVIELRQNTHKTEASETATPSETESESAADTRAYNLTKAYNNSICAVMQLETTSDAVREWIRFSRMSRDEIQGTITDIGVAIEHLQKLGETLSGCLGPQRLK